MTTPFTGKRIVFGITGGIAAYKAADWVRGLRQEGADVQVIMTRAATRFVSPMTFAALSGHPVECDILDSPHHETIPHISLAKECDLLLIAPATANTIARLAHGMADTMLTAVVLATTAKVVVFPAMNSAMYQHPATQGNLQRLTELGYNVIPPACGAMACGDHGPGRLPDWPTALDCLAAALSPQDLSGRHFLITAGPTREPMDPVRFLSNPATGKMGYALARAARQRGAGVTLVSGPTTIAAPSAVDIVRVNTALEMHQAVMARYENADVVIKTAAVSDFRPAQPASHKIKKGDKQTMGLGLIANPDILWELGQQRGETRAPILVGFAAESDHHLEEGYRKLRKKHLDLMVVNDIMGSDTGFASDTNQVTIIDRQGGKSAIPLLSKDETAHLILDRIRDLF